MWDLDTLHYLNYRAAKEQRQNKLKADTPLGSLVLQLQAPRPPALSILLRLFDSAESYSEFVKLVREYLPEREQDILSETSPSAQMAAFASYFEDRYLPLEPRFRDGDIEDDYYELLRELPVTFMGMSWEDYESLNDYRLGLQLMSFLVECPLTDSGVRVSLADGFPEAYQPDAGRLPAGGVKLAVARRILNSKKWLGLKNWAEILFQDTGNWFLDTDEEMRYSGYGGLEWNKDNVESMARDWKAAEAFYDKALDFASWLENEKSGPAHFKETIDFLLDNLNKDDYAE